MTGGDRRPPSPIYDVVPSAGHRASLCPSRRFTTTNDARQSPETCSRSHRPHLRSPILPASSFNRRISHVPALFDAEPSRSAPAVSSRRAHLRSCLQLRAAPSRNPIRSAPITKAGATKQVGIWSVDGWNRGNVGSHCSAERPVPGAAPGGGVAAVRPGAAPGRLSHRAGRRRLGARAAVLLPGRADRSAGPAARRQGRRRDAEDRHRRPWSERRDDAAACAIADVRGQDRRRPCSSCRSKASPRR